MSFLNGTKATDTKGDTAAYHNNFNPPKGGEQRHGMYQKKLGKSKILEGKNQKEPEEKDQWVKVNNYANTNDAVVLMECMEKRGVLA
eukprot:12838217-Ditylum_brightwellii.AAC.1